MSVTLCTTCHESLAKYRCPACVSHTCSLACSKIHKDATNCSGKRNQTKFIPRSKFDDASINNDYNFLTTLERDLDNASRLNSNAPVSRNFNQIKAFAKRAHDVGEVTVKLAPRGMKRAKTNKSSWVAKKGHLSWTIEWLFEGTIRKVSDRVLDSATVDEAVAFHRRKLGDELELYKTTNLDTLKYLIRNEDIPGSQPTFAILDVSKTMAEALRHRTVIEYPTIYIYSEIPSNLKLERQYGYVQTAVESIAPSSKVTDVQSTAQTGGDFIAFNMDDEDGEEGEEQEMAGDSVTISQVEKDSKQISAFGLPVVDFDDLKVPYS